MISIISILRAIYWEIKIDLLSTLRYRFGIISDLVIYSMLLGFFFTSKTNTSIEREFIYLNYQELLFWGYIAWTLAVAAISSIGGEIRSELIHGTFYGKMNSKYPLQILLFGKLISSVIIQVCITLILSFFAIVIWSVQIRFNFLLFLFLAICTIGMYGLGLFLGGLALYFKKIGAIVFIIKFALLFITDTIPTNEYIIFFSRWLPLTAYNNLLRKYLNNDLIANDFIALIILSGLYLICGSFFFAFLFDKAKKKGNILLY